MENNAKVVASSAVAGDTKPLSKSVVSRTWTLPKDQFDRIVAVRGYGETADTLVMKVVGVELLPHETSFIASVVYESGLDAIKLEGESYEDREPTGILITTFKPRA